VIAKTPGDGQHGDPDGETLSFAVPERALCRFDAATGARLR